MNNLQRFAGVAALFEAIIYISAFIFFGALWDFPSDGSIQQKFTFLTENQIIFTVVNLLMYIVFGLLLAVLVLGLHQRLKGYSETLSNLAAIFGIIWVALVVASGMVANIGLNTVLQLSLTDPEQAMTIWLTINTIVEGIGGGNELVGGLWVVIISYSSLKANVFPKLFTYFGLFVGFTGIATIYPEEILTAIFGLSQIIWFIFLGVLMLIRTPK